MKLVSEDQLKKYYLNLYIKIYYEWRVKDMNIFNKEYRELISLCNKFGEVEIEANKYPNLIFRLRQDKQYYHEVNVK